PDQCLTDHGTLPPRRWGRRDYEGGSKSRATCCLPETTRRGAFSLARSPSAASASPNDDVTAIDDPYSDVGTRFSLSAGAGRLRELIIADRGVELDVREPRRGHRIPGHVADGERDLDAGHVAV